MHPEKIILAPLWDNAYFLRKNKKIKVTDYPNISDKIKTAADFFEPGTSRLLTKREMEQKYDLTINDVNFVELRLIIKQSIASIGLSIESIKAPYCPSKPLLIDIVTMCQKGCNLYSRLLNMKPENSNPMGKREERWHSELDCTFGMDFWRRTYLRVSCMKEDNKLKWFQYQINRNSLFTNYKVNKFKSFISPLCSFCGEQPELVSHLFKKCNRVNEFWSEIKEWLGTFNLILPLTISEILFGSHDASSKVNYILLCGKYFIWKARLTNQTLSPSLFKMFLYNKLESKKQAYVYGENLAEFSEWSDIYINLSGSQCRTALAPTPIQEMNHARTEEDTLSQ